MTKIARTVCVRIKETLMLSNTCMDVYWNQLEEDVIKAGTIHIAPSPWPHSTSIEKHCCIILDSAVSLLFAVQCQLLVGPATYVCDVINGVCMTSA